MSLLNRRWNIRKNEDGFSEDILKEFGISKIISQILANRGIKEKSDINRFLSPRISYLNDPFEIPDMQKAVDRTMLARQKKEKVLVWGDYDVDGVTATSIVVLGLKKIGMEASYYIPHRYNEGYGMNIEALKKISSQGVSLIITVDCGVSNVKEIAFAKSLGIDVIVTDHHNIPEKLPDSVAAVNPKRLNKNHPSRDLSGAGVAFKFIWALLRTAGIKDSQSIKEFLDLAALGTVADVVPLTRENRILTVSGMKVLGEKKRVGVRQLCEKSGMNGEVTARNISFMLAPRLNAPGRLKHAGLSIKLLLEDDPQKAKGIADEISLINSQRQQIGSLIGQDVFSKLSDPETKKLIMLSGKNWHPGVIGIVASRISEKFNRPTILISEDGDSCRGSARSIENFDIYKLLMSCKDLFSDFGGHKDAAGFEMPTEMIPALKERLSKEIEAFLSVDELAPRTNIDLEIDFDRISIDLAREIEKLSPFGHGNPDPVLMSRKLKVVESKKVGSKGNHLKIKFSDGNNCVDSIGFGMGALSKDISKDGYFDVAYNLSVNQWDGFQFPQIGIVDIRRAAK